MTVKLASMTRRNFVASAASIGFVSLLPARAFAQAEPISATAAIGVAMSVVGAIMTAKTNAEFKRSLRQINSKLDNVILNQQQLLEEIRDLRLYISEEIFRQFRYNAEFDLRVYGDRYNFLMAEGFNSRSRRRYEDLANDIQDITNKLGLYDFGAFMTFASGVSMTLVLRRFLRTNPAQWAILKRSFKTKCESWLDQKNQAGVIRALEVAATERQALEKAIADFPRNYVTNRFTDYPGSQVCQNERRLAITGDIETGFAGQETSVQTRCEQQREHEGGCRGPQCLVTPGLFAKDKSDQPVALLEELSPDYSNIPTAPSPSSPYRQVNRINGIRNDLIAAMRHERDIQFVASQIRKMSAVLS